MTNALFFLGRKGLNNFFPRRCRYEQALIRGLNNSYNDNIFVLTKKINCINISVIKLYIIRMYKDVFAGH